MNNKRIIAIMLFAIIMVNCRDNYYPKPKAMLRLEYADATSKLLETDNFQFEYNLQAHLKTKDNGSMNIDYPRMKGSIFISYKKVENNIVDLMSDAQRLSYEHAARADNIVEQPFINNENQVYGMFYEVKGDAASQSQFYVTDSTDHFVTGSLYFYAKPNYDSILPAAMFLQKDIRKIMETLRWKE